MASAKDDKNVVKFMALFAKLREWTDDDPSDLESAAKTDQPLADLCWDLGFVSQWLAAAEHQGHQRFATPVDPKFMEAWRAFEQRYDVPVAGVCLQVLGFDLQKLPASTSRGFERKWEIADEEGKAFATGLADVLGFVEDQVSDPDRFAADLREGILDANSRWSRFAEGYDLRGVFRRRALVPFVLIPRHVGQHYGQAETLSLMTLLRQAHDAFMFGAPFAALALMRSILEVTLKKHYQSRGADLEELIDHCRALPKAVRKSDLQRLRRLANGILHFNPEKIKPDIDMEREVLNLLYSLRALLEGVPQSQMPGPRR